MRYPHHQDLLRIRFGCFLLVCLVLLEALAGSSYAQDYVYTNPASDSYVLTKSHVSLSSNVTVDDIDRLNKQFAGDFLWVRHAGKEFLIRDHAVISEAQRLFLPVDSLESESEKIHEKRKQLESEQVSLGEEQKALERKLESTSDHTGSNAPNSERDAAEHRLSDLKSKMIALEAQASQLDSSQTAFEGRSKVIEFQIEQALWKLVDRALMSGLGGDPDRE